MPIMHRHTCKLTLISARQLTLEAAQSVGSARTINNRPNIRDIPIVQIKKLLDSRNEREVLDGLRKVISVRYHSRST